MTQRDQFVYSAPTATSGSRVNTGVLANEAQGDVELLADLDGQLVNAERADTGLGVRIEALRRGCEAAGIPTPNAPIGPEQMPPVATRVITYLTHKLPQDPPLTLAVQLAVSRFGELKNLIRQGKAAQVARCVAPAMLVSLKRTYFFLSHLYEHFRHDPELKTVFPPPQITAVVFDEQREVRAIKVASEVERARKLLEKLNQPFAAVRQTLSIIDRVTAFEVKAIFEPGARQARQVALALTGRPEAVAMLREAVVQHEALEQAVQGPDPTTSPEAWAALAKGLDDMALRCQQDAALRMLFPANLDNRFPKPGDMRPSRTSQLGLGSPSVPRANTP